MRCKEECEIGQSLSISQQRGFTFVDNIPLFSHSQGFFALPVNTSTVLNFLHLSSSDSLIYQSHQGILRKRQKKKKEKQQCVCLSVML